MRPFDLNSAKLGEAVCLKDGSKARIICFNRKHRDYPIIVLRTCGDVEIVETYNEKGHHISDSQDSLLDLKMATKESEGYVKPTRKISNVDNLSYNSTNVYRVNGSVLCAKSLEDVITLYVVINEGYNNEINTIEVLHKGVGILNG